MMVTFSKIVIVVYRLLQVRGQTQTILFIKTLFLHQLPPSYTPIPYASTALSIYIYRLIDCSKTPLGDVDDLDFRRKRTFRKQGGYSVPSATWVNQPNMTEIRQWQRTSGKPVAGVLMGSIQRPIVQLVDFQVLSPFGQSVAVDRTNLPSTADSDQLRLKRLDRRQPEGTSAIFARSVASDLHKPAAVPSHVTFFARG